MNRIEALIACARHLSQHADYRERQTTEPMRKEQLFRLGLRLRQAAIHVEYQIENGTAVARGDADAHLVEVVEEAVSALDRNLRYFITYSIEQSCGWVKVCEIPFLTPVAAQAWIDAKRREFPADRAAFAWRIPSFGFANA